MRFSSDGQAAYGYNPQVAVDGAIPAPLVGRFCGLGAWQSDTQLIYQDGGTTGAGPWQVNRLTYPGLTTDTVSATGANNTAAGGGVWAKWLGNEGVTTSYGGLYPSAYLLDVSHEGFTAVCDTYATGVGITVYDDTGTEVYEDATVALTNQKAVRLRNGILAYLTSGGWNLVDIDTGLSPGWVPRLDIPALVVPCVFGGVLYLLELGNASANLTLRTANRDRGWVLSPIPNTFGPDMVPLASTIRVGSCTAIGEATDTLVVLDITVNDTGALTVATGTVVAGAIVYGAPATVNFQGFTVGPFINPSGIQSSLVPNIAVPFEQSQNDQKGKPTQPWVRFYSDLAKAVNTLSGNVEAIPAPVPAAGFTQIDSPGQPSIVPNGAQTVLTISSNDGTITIVTNPNANIVDLSVTGGSGGYAPLTTGAEPLVFVSDGAGHVIMTPYTP